MTQPNAYQLNSELDLVLERIIDVQRELIWKAWSFLITAAIRKVIYTTNAVESLNASLQKVLKHNKSFMDDEAMMKVIYLNGLETEYRFISSTR